MKKTGFALLLLALFVPAMLCASSDEARLLRFPAVGGDKIVFSYAGDLYSVDIDGGVANRLTSHPGYESFARISPDGSTIAFTGQYDGNTEVYTMPIEGGEPKRLTWSATVSRDQIGERMGPNNIVMGWTPDGKKIVYRSKQYTFSGLRGNLCLVDAQNPGVPEFIPTTEGGFCSFSPDGTKLAMNRMFREFRTWKYYRGGQADDIWINTVGTTELVNITNNDAQDIFPMWTGGKVYYLSDRDRTMNLFAYDPDSGETVKVTHFTEYDCKFPSYSSEWIVFENGGYIYKYDVVNGGEPQKVEIQLQADDIWGRSEYRSDVGRLSSFSLSPDGTRVLAIARGDIFSFPATEGPVYNLTKSPGSHEREVSWSPDGKTIAWISDASGEYQIYSAPYDDLASARALTSFEKGYPYGLVWSPESDKLYFCTDERGVYEVNMQNRKVEKILESDRDRIRSFNLSPDGQWAAYVMSLPNNVSAVYLMDLSSRKSYQITDQWSDSNSPMFSRDGKYLFFSSDKNFSFNYSSMEWNVALHLRGKAFVLPLAADTQNPMSVKGSEYSPSDSSKDEDADGPRGRRDDEKGGPRDKKDDKKPGNAPAEKVKVKVDLEGIQDRITALPINASRFIISKDDKLYYNEDRERGTKVLDLKTLKITDGPSAQYLAFTPDASKVLVRERNDYSVVSFGAPAGRGENVPIKDADIVVDKVAEWKQIFDESWRVMRDGFYVENMHGADWDAVYDKYACMLPYVRHRDDLTYLIGEMIGELNVGHAYITSGETPQVQKVRTGLLGAKYSKDESTGYFRIESIFAGADWSEDLKSPLLAPGVNAKVGDYIVEINGVSTSDLSDVGEALVGKVGKTVALTLSENSSAKNVRKVYVVPVGDESQLAYYNWVKTNIEKVDKLSDGQIGYIHIPDMGPEGLEMFTRLYYSQLDKKALVIDDRMNGGGNVSPIILERLQRQVYRMNMRRNGINETVPNQAFYGPMVCIIDKYSSSDGDLFPYGFRKLGLGKIIGKRSWGGIVGISGSKPYLDGQDMRVPFFTSYSVDGEWIIEGYGVDPDIEVDINPFEDYLGKDAQLEKAVELLLEELDNWSPLPPTPEAPVKN